MTQTNPIAQIFTERLINGLQRGALQGMGNQLVKPLAAGCSRWAKMYRVMGKPFVGPWTYAHHPWLEAMHTSEAELNIGQKAAQVGYTELLLNWTFYNIDINGESVLYVLPTDDNAGDFSSSRFDVALELSTHLNQLFSDVKNTKHKRAGSANLFIRGSRSKNKLISVPVARVAVDEMDKMVLEHIPLIWERMSGQPNKQVWFVSTPTIDGVGINKYYQESSRQHFFFTCPHCSKLIEMKFPDSIIITSDDIHNPKLKESHYICSACKGKLVHEDKLTWLSKGQWVAEDSSMDSAGWYINQMYSHTVSPFEFAKAYLKSITNPADEQEFYNSKLGMPHIVEGARVNIGDINNCLGTFINGKESSRTSIVTMGVDVGKWLHVEIDEWVLDREGQLDIHSAASPDVLLITKVQDFEELDKLMLRYGINACVIDANPEKRKSLEFCNRFNGIAFACYYGNDSKGKKEIAKSSSSPFITVDRTSWIDMALNRFHKGKKGIRLPYDLKMEYKEHIMNLVKVYSKDGDGNTISTYMNGGRDDHYGHTRTYAEIALSLAITKVGNQNISGVS